MTLSIDWINSRVVIPKAHLTLVTASPEVYALDMDEFRLELKAIEASEEGMPFVDIHKHTAQSTLAGITYARFVEIINGFEVYVDADPPAFQLLLLGANNNLQDKVYLTGMPETQTIGTNSKGLINLPEVTANLAAAIAARVQATIVANNTQPEE